MLLRRESSAAQGLSGMVDEDERGRTFTVLTVSCRLLSHKLDAFSHPCTEVDFNNP
jgi:hypothetical protein